jgi:UDP-N-acetylglucosamine 2-epimerase (non-hydrolysing)
MTKLPPPLKVMLVAGARPNFMKIASVHEAIRRRNSSRPILDPCLVHTGQHYDEAMSRAFFEDLGLPEPDVHLSVGSGSHGSQTGEILMRFEPVLLELSPDVVVVGGDVNSTAAAALVAAKASYPQPTARGSSRPRIAHVEAGLRSFDRSMPEEVNRIVTDSLSDLLFITERSAKENLLREGIPPSRIHFVGNTMVDTLLRHRSRAAGSPILDRLGLRDASPPGVRDYAVVTLHRPSNVDRRESFEAILKALEFVARRMPVLFPMHPRTRKRVEELGLGRFLEASPRLRSFEPLGYLDFLALMSHCRLMLTDSGGIQEETTVLGVPCVTLRENTERPVTVESGTNLVAGTRTENIIRLVRRQLAQSPRRRLPARWDGKAGERIVEILLRPAKPSRRGRASP